MASPTAPFVTDSTVGVDNTQTQLLLGHILMALDPQAGNSLPDDVAQLIWGNETQSM